MKEQAISIEVVFDNGHTISAQGKHAEDIWNWLRLCMGLAVANGCEYTGKPMNESSVSETRIANA